MFKKVLLVAGICFCITTPAISADGPYFSANIGISSTTDSDVTEPGFNGELTFDSGFAFSGALGQKMGNGRIEAEIGYKTADIDNINAYGVTVPINGDFTLLSLMGNGYVDFDVSTAVNPYVMGGIGMAKITGTIDGEEEDDTVLAYQLGLGIGLPVNDKITIDLGYRYMGTSNPDFSGSEFTYASHNFLAGLRLNF